MTTIFSLTTRDLIRGVLMAAIVPSLVIIQSSIAAGAMTFNWRQIGMAAVGGGVGHILRKYFTNDIPEAKKTLADARLKEQESPTKN